MLCMGYGSAMKFEEPYEQCGWMMLHKCGAVLEVCGSFPADADMRFGLVVATRILHCSYCAATPASNHHANLVHASVLKGHHQALSKTPG